MARAPLLFPAVFIAALAYLCTGEAPGVPSPASPRTFDGIISGDVRTRDGLSSFAFAGDGLSLRTTLPGTFVPGERLLVRGRPAPFDPARNPGETAPRDLARAAGFDAQLLHAHLAARGPVDAGDTRAWPARLRAALTLRIRSILPEPHATVLAGALLGARGDLPHDLDADFRATGTVHILITAGLHLGALAACAGLCAQLLQIPRIAAALGTIPLVAAYAWLTGAHLPSRRAAVMVSIGLIARACGARTVSINTIAAAAIAVLLLEPAAVRSVSFALSFSCVGSIALFAQPVGTALERAALPGRIREALALTAATQVGVWPLSAATFGVLAPYAVLANAVAVPATALALPLGAAALAFPVLAPLVTLDLELLLRAVTAIASLPGARVCVAPPPGWAVVCYDGAAVAAASLLRTRGRAAAAVLALASAALLATTLRPPDGRFTMVTLDVGQGDGHVLRTPRGRTILIDAGGVLERGGAAEDRSPAERAADRVVLPYVRRSGIARVDLLILTHPHGDHVGGCRGILEALPVSLILDSGQPYGGRAYADCRAAAERFGVPVKVARAGGRWESGDGVTVDVLGPSEPLIADGRDDVNENSVVVRVTYLRKGAPPFRALFTGDAGSGSERRLLANGTDLRAQFLKVGHHGSRFATTPEFVSAVSPSVAVISDGRENRFGHPAAATLETLRRAGAAVVRTDRCGAITTVADTAEIHTMLCGGRAAGGRDVRAP